MSKKRLTQIYIRIFAIILGIFTLFFVGYIIFSTGVFDKTPHVETKPNNTYAETIHVVTDKDYQPYSFVDSETNEPTGHDVELIYKIANKLEVNVDLKLLSWGECLDKLEDGGADVAMTCGTADSFDFTVKPILSNITSQDEYVVYSKKSFNSQELFGSNLKVGYMIDGNVVGVIQQMGLLDNYIGVASNKDILLQIKNGELDAGIMRHNIGTTILDELNISNIKARYSLSPSYMCFAINGDKASLAAKINDVLDEMRSNGELNKLNNKWLTTFVAPNSVWEVLSNNIWIIFILVLLAIAFVIVIVVANMRVGKVNSRLAYEVDELQRRNKIIEGLSNDFVDVSYVTIDDDKFKDSTFSFRSSKYLNSIISKEEGFSKRLDSLINNFVYEEDREKVYKSTRRENILNELKNKEAHFVRFRGIVNNQLYYFELKFNAVRDDEGKVTNFVVGIHDIDSDTKAMLKQEETLEEAKLIAEQASKAKTTFLFNMSHDIRTPMNAISGYTHLAKANINDTKKLSDYLSKIDIACGNLIELVNQVLEMSRIESGKVELQNNSVDLMEKMNTILEISKVNASLKDIRIALSYENIRNPYVLTDGGRLNQIISNIVGNAVKYTRENGLIQITVAQEENENPELANYKFVVKDNGIGMSQEFLDHIFEEFARENTSTISKIQGTGLGMSIVKRLVDIFGGTINVESKQDVGTKITVVLPLSIDTNFHSSEAVSDEDINLKGMKILLVEDNEMNREIASEILNASGAIITQAEDGDIAVDLVKNSHPGDIDLILMDIQMPRMNGYDATKAIRKLENKDQANIPIIAMTANTFEEDRKLALDIGMNGHIGKPFDVNMLKKALLKFKK